MQTTGQINTLKEVARVTRKIFLKCGIPFRVCCDGGLKFRCPFKDMLEEFHIPYTLSSPYNSPSNGLAERHMGNNKTLLKKSIDSKTDFQDNLTHLNNSAQPDGFSATELFYRHWPRCLMPDIITDAEIEKGMKSREVSHQQMRSNMRKTKDRKSFNKVDYVLYQEQVGQNAGKWVRTLEVIEARLHE